MEVRSDEFQSSINNWLDKNNVTVIEIKYSTHYDSGYARNVYSALIIYEKDGEGKSGN